MTDVRQRLGMDRGEWPVEKVHHAFFVHSVRQVWPLDRLFSRSIPHGGDGQTAPWALFAQETVQHEGAATYHMIVDMTDVTQAQSMNAIGQAGRPFTAHYEDMLRPWAEVEYHPMWMEKAEIIEHSEETLVLKSSSPQLLR